MIVIIIMLIMMAVTIIILIHLAIVPTKKTVSILEDSIVKNLVTTS